MKQLICIVCPRGCHLQVDESKDYAVSGNACPRGAEYGRNECLNPTRVVTSTVRTSSPHHPRCSVKTDKPIPKPLMEKLVRLLDSVTLAPPIHRGDVVIDHLPGTEDARFIATRDILE